MNWFSFALGFAAAFVLSGVVCLAIGYLEWLDYHSGEDEDVSP